MCPFMIYGELVQHWRIASGATLLKWPREAMDKWGAWFLFGMFAVILVWEVRRARCARPVLRCVLPCSWRAAGREARA